MEIMKKKGYLAPAIEVYFLEVEQGIAISENIEQLGILFDEQEW